MTALLPLPCLPGKSWQSLAVKRHPEYERRAQEIASLLKEEDLVSCDCHCFDVGAYADGAKPENYKTFAKAALAYTYNRIVGIRYWGVHLKRVHVVHIHHEAFGNRGQLSCVECLRRKVANATDSQDVHQ